MAVKRFLYRDRDWLTTQYWDGNLSQKQIAHVASCDLRTVRRWMSKYQIPTRGPSDAKKLVWQDEECRQRYLAAQTPELRRRMSRILTEQWQDEEMSAARRQGLLASWAERVDGRSWCDKEWLVEQYEGLNLTQQQVADIAGCSVITIRRWLRRHGIQRHSQSEAAKKDWASRRQVFSMTCEECGGEIEIRPFEVGKRRFCSMKCKGQWQSKNIRGEISPAWRGGQTECTCKFCGRKFKVDPCIVKMGWGHFCSNQCKYRWNAGENNHFWKGGRSFEPYPLEFNAEFKHMIRERDNYTCAVCRLSGNNVHHINYIKDDTVVENCVTLCKSCHAVTNSHRDYWQKALESMMEARCQYNYQRGS